MKGRTRSFFEDVFVLLLILGVLIAGYYFFFSGEEKEQQSIQSAVTEIQNDQPEIIKEEFVSQIEHNETVEKEQSLKVQSEISNEQDKDVENISETLPTEEKQEIKQQETSPDIQKNDDQIDQKTTANKVDPNRIAYLVKNVDLQLLKQFKIDVKKSMEEKIVLNEDQNLADQNFSIRITVLKNGEQEQLTFTGGNKEIFEKNQENLVKIFPLQIDPKIAQDFPRYLRYSFQFTQKEN